ncbi:MAG: diadenylate cyclase CdaA [Oscillospiraceae bacterium]|nr:diadenylate cyclase CdaA [Oscillospiraceae bacterium]MDD4369265.1 diadenylate cyclase CdaA [Oscillospiraceae bacterium]
MTLSMNAQIMNQFVQFFSDLYQTIGSSWLLFGTPKDIILMIIDILVTSLVVYFVLKIMADTRAWQLLKGILFIITFTFICQLIGLQTINYVLSNSISVLAIGVVVIFQPEMRRALETVGRNSLRFFNSMSPAESSQEARSLHNMIESLVVACEHMAATKTGALILLERTTKLGELVQGTAVVLDSVISSTGLEQIFYKGSPLHDGAVIIRNDRIYAARCHVPLSDNYHMRRDYGTRHRAAVGASEIGDTVGIVVSEERGAISVTLGGRLYPMADGDALRAVLHKLLTPETAVSGGKKSIRRVLQNVVHEETELVSGVPVQEAQSATVGISRKMKVLLFFASLIMASGLWFFVQIQTNPIQDITISTISVQLENVDSTLEEHGLAYNRADNTVSIHFRVRKKYAAQISRENVYAVVDFTELDFADISQDLQSDSQSLQKLPIHVGVNGLASLTYQVVSWIPSEQSLVFSLTDSSSDSETSETTEVQSNDSTQTEDDSNDLQDVLDQYNTETQTTD